MKTYGTCLGCNKVKRIRQNMTSMVSGRREGWCEECESKQPKPKPRLMVNYKDKK